MNVEAECHPSELQKHTLRDKVHAGTNASDGQIQGLLGAHNQA